MSDQAETAKLYNIDELIRTTSLDVPAGIAECGSRRAYFEALFSFTSSCPLLYVKVWQIENNKIKFIKDLKQTREMLRMIGDRALRARLDGIMTQYTAGEKIGPLSDSFYIAQGMIKTLCERIEKARLNVGFDEDNEAGEAYESNESNESKKAMTERLRALLQKKNKQPSETAAPQPEPREGTQSEDALSTEAPVASQTGINQTSSDETSTSSNTLSASGGAEGKKRILAIDDAPEELSVLKNLLGERYALFAVEDHVAALKFLSDSVPDLILLGIELPVMDGLTLIKLIRQMEPLKKTPVIFMARRASSETIKTAFEAGGNDFIKKPVDASIEPKIEKFLK